MADSQPVNNSYKPIKKAASSDGEWEEFTPTKEQKSEWEEFTPSDADKSKFNQIDIAHTNFYRPPDTAGDAAWKGISALGEKLNAVWNPMKVGENIAQAEADDFNEAQRLTTPQKFLHGALKGVASFPPAAIGLGVYNEGKQIVNDIINGGYAEAGGHSLGNAINLASLFAGSHINPEVAGDMTVGAIRGPMNWKSGLGVGSGTYLGRQAGHFIGHPDLGAAIGGGSVIAGNAIRGAMEAKAGRSLFRPWLLSNPEVLPEISPEVLRYQELLKTNPKLAETYRKTILEPPQADQLVTPTYKQVPRGGIAPVPGEVPPPDPVKPEIAKYMQDLGVKIKIKKGAGPSSFNPANTPEPADNIYKRVLGDESWKTQEPAVLPKEEPPPPKEWAPVSKGETSGGKAKIRPAATGIADIDAELAQPRLYKPVKKTTSGPRASDAPNYEKMEQERKAAETNKAPAAEAPVANPPKRTVEDISKELVETLKSEAPTASEDKITDTTLPGIQKHLANINAKVDNLFHYAKANGITSQDLEELKVGDAAHEQTWLEHQAKAWIHNTKEGRKVPQKGYRGTLAGDTLPLIIQRLKNDEAGILKMKPIAEESPAAEPGQP